MRGIVLLLVALFASCSRGATDEPPIVSMQIVDRNGFSETISSKDRLNSYQKTDFLASQPYQKVVRVYGQAASKVTTYHPNGQLWQYLEIEKGRAHGSFIEWHANGQKKIEAHVIAGTPDISELAQATWLFDRESLVYDEAGRCIARIRYNKGVLEGASEYYFPTGEIAETMPFSNGLKQGRATRSWSPSKLEYDEIYDRDLLISGEYFNREGEKIASIADGSGKKAVFGDDLGYTVVEYSGGVAAGAVQQFNTAGELTTLYHIKNGMKNGDEWEYYPHNSQPKLHLQWKDDVIEGVVKTWYDNGTIESQREVHDNKKNGTSYAWFKEGDLMFMEEYQDDLLMKGSYFKRWSQEPVSKIENGKGVATLFDPDGKLLKSIPYEKGIPQDVAEY